MERFLIIATTDKVLSWHISDLYSFMKLQETEVRNGIATVYTANFDDIGCSHMSPNELSCLYLDARKTWFNDSIKNYQILDIVQIDENITIIHSLDVTLWSDFYFHQHPNIGLCVEPSPPSFDGQFNFPFRAGRKQSRT